MHALGQVTEPKIHTNIASIWVLLQIPNYSYLFLQIPIIFRYLFIQKDINYQSHVHLKLQVNLNHHLTVTHLVNKLVTGRHLEGLEGFECFEECY